MPSILVADDDPDLREILSTVFTSAGMQVMTAADGTSALNSAEHHRPDVVLADFDMPGLTGAQLCQAMREHHYLRSVPVAILTGYLIVGDPRMREISYCALMFQPRSNKDLIAIMHRLIDQGNHHHDQHGACLIQAGTEPTAQSSTRSGLMFSPPPADDEPLAVHPLPGPHSGTPKSSPRSWRTKPATTVHTEDL